MFLVVVVSVVGVMIALSQADGPSRNHPAIAYDSSNLKDPVTVLAGKVVAGQVQLDYDSQSGYLRSLLKALNIPIESQVAVFSKTSLQSGIIAPDNPRTIFFNDSVAVAWPRGGFIELASVDPQQGVIFYALGRRGRLNFFRDPECLTCHVSSATLRVPGLAIGSVYPADDGTAIMDAPNFTTDHRNSLDQRWGGWYVTGETGSTKHLGNRVVSNVRKPEMLKAVAAPRLDSLKGKFDLTGYLSPYSDVVALMVLEHQAHMTNLIICLGWENRISTHDRSRTSHVELVKELVDYMLFVDEPPLLAKIKGSSGFAENFQLLGPKDSKGRSLRQFGLERHLMRYPCSYMIYSPAFEGMPADARDAVYKRMWQILSGEDRNPKYSRLSVADRQAVIEILRATKPGLPSYFIAANRN